MVILGSETYGLMSVGNLAITSLPVEM